MTDDNSKNLVDMEDLDKFADTLFGKTEVGEEEAAEEVEDTEDDALATDEDTDAPDGDETEAEEDSEEEEEDEESEPKPEEKGKKSKTSYQERINELTRARREAERQNAELLRRLEALETRSNKDSAQEPTVQEQLPQGAPDPKATDKDGNPVYPLGEFDPDYIRDISQFVAKEEFRKLQEAQKQEAEKRQLMETQQALQASWNSKLEKAEEVIPEIREHISELVDVFHGIDPSYGEYLAMTIMQCENGPAVMEYLSQNIGEAQKIVASGPAAATRAIGRLDGKLESLYVRSGEDAKRNKKTSAAPPVPTSVTRGSRGQPTVRGDTDNLDAFEKVFFKK